MIEKGSVGENHYGVGGEGATQIGTAGEREKSKWELQ